MDIDVRTLAINASALKIETLAQFCEENQSFIAIYIYEKVHEINIPLFHMYVNSKQRREALHKMKCKYACLKV